MGSRKKIPGKDAFLFDIMGLSFSKVYRSDAGGVHQIVFFKEGGSYVQWGSGCCCDVATIDFIDGDLENLVDTHIKEISAQEVDQYRALFKFKTEKGMAMVQWTSKHPGFVHKGVKVTLQ
jgi:hypothetical protein